eukprot:CAMPEP_0206527912 /NCGR_PEP_ID=MMETSP0325_2-20121206/1639_1 /ASSEMBLY_ACC=CAM_ASM_000347 /TAXON_ID=2866 /ORGANISM="Crypthecodinium cohnii, Strain Seligo" /LENGTH=46 /DNA_ID= /DNA_START= /DNA_END= /DNA_ORIENTATION=
MLAVIVGESSLPRSSSKSLNEIDQQLARSQAVMADLTTFGARTVPM